MTFRFLRGDTHLSLRRVCSRSAVALTWSNFIYTFRDYWLLHFYSRRDAEDNFADVRRKLIREYQHC